MTPSPRRTATGWATSATVSAWTARRSTGSGTECSRDLGPAGVRLARGRRGRGRAGRRAPRAGAALRTAPRRALLRLGRPAARVGLPRPAVVHAVPGAAGHRDRTAPPAGAAADEHPRGGRDRAARGAVRAAARRRPRRPGADRRRGRGVRRTDGARAPALD